MTLVSEEILTTSQVDHRLLEMLRLFMQNYKEMPVYQRDIMFDVIQHLVKNPAPIETAYLKERKKK